MRKATAGTIPPNTSVNASPPIPIVAVKPHGSPVLHALNYLMGNLDREWLTRLRSFGGLQAYPSRTKDPDRVRSARSPIAAPALVEVFTPGRPVVTVQEASSHHLAWLGLALAAPSASLGVDGFGQSGAIPDLYREFHLDSGSIVNASLGVLGL